MTISASTIIGNDVKNSAGENLGDVKDLMINPGTGEIEYAVLSFGGILGIGDKYFAVPLEAMQLDTKDEQFVLNETKERLENAPGFDKDNWPDHADGKWVHSVRNYYNLQPRM